MSDALLIAIITGIFALLGKALDLYVGRPKVGETSQPKDGASTFNPTKHGGILNPSTVGLLLVGIVVGVLVVRLPDMLKPVTSTPVAQSGIVVQPAETEAASPTSTTTPTATVTLMPTATELPENKAASPTPTTTPTVTPTITPSPTANPLTAQIISNAAIFSQPNLRGLLRNLSKGKTVTVLGHYPDHVLYPSSVCVEIAGVAGWMAQSLFYLPGFLPDLPSTACPPK